MDRAAPSERGGTRLKIIVGAVWGKASTSVMIPLARDDACVGVILHSMVDALLARGKVCFGVLLHAAVDAQVARGKACLKVLLHEMINARLAQVTVSL